VVQGEDFDVPPERPLVDRDPFGSVEDLDGSGRQPHAQPAGDVPGRYRVVALPHADPGAFVDTGRKQPCRIKRLSWQGRACQVFCVSGHGRGLVEVGVDSFWVGHGEYSEHLAPSTGSSAFDEVAAAA
jgi:hypothetical protein